MKLGIIGLGRAFLLMRPTLLAHPGIEIVAAADPRPEATRRFEAQFGGRPYSTAEALCSDPDVEAVYIASPHQDHAAQACAAARSGKHVLVEKPMAVTLAECDAMIEAAGEAGVQLVIGHSHSFDAPIARTRALVAGGAFGGIRMVTALNYTDFLYRPRRPEELDTAKGGGVFFSQAAHQVDVVRALVGARVSAVRASAGAWDPARPTEGAYGAHLSFDNGAFATLTYSGYGHFDSDELMGGIGELGERKESAYGVARRSLSGIGGGEEESALKDARSYGGERESEPRPPVAHQHFGFLVVSCERADLRPMANGIHIYEDQRARFEPLAPPAIPRAEVIDEFISSIQSGRHALHDGHWGRGTLEVCIAMLRSSREGREIAL
jgi:phthalate 4,5-cis-dihydrodiol dehydrogenase